MKIPMFEIASYLAMTRYMNVIARAAPASLRAERSNLKHRNVTIIINTEKSYELD